MVQAVIGVGSNVDREKNIASALDQLSKLFGELSISPVYKSTSSIEGRVELNGYDLDAQRIFYYNLVVAIETDKDVVGLKCLLRAIEQRQKRSRNGLMVTLDLDLLLYGDWLGEFNGNTIPHSDVTEYAYVLRPLADLLPNKLHPVYGKRYDELWSEFSKSKTVSSVDFIWGDRVISNTGCPLLL